jgi:hypothetical protein
VRVLRALGAGPHALRVAYDYIDRFEHHELSLRGPFLQLEVSLLEAQLGKFDEAVARLSRVTAEREAIGVRGFLLGIFYETSARIALLSGDREAFAAFAAKCGDEYALRPSANLRVKYTNLIDEAHEQGLARRTGFPVPEALAHPASVEAARVEALRIQLAECIDKADRARCAVSLLLKSANTYRGYLYSVESTDIVLLAGLPEHAVDSELDGWLRAWVEAERSRSETETQTGGASTEADATVTGDSPTASGGGIEPRMMYTKSDGTSFVVTPLILFLGRSQRLLGLFVTQRMDARVPRPQTILCRELGRLLYESGDLTGIDI